MTWGTLYWIGVLGMLLYSLGDEKKDNPFWTHLIFALIWPSIIAGRAFELFLTSGDKRK